MKEKSFRGDDLEPGRRPSPVLDPVAEGAALGLSADVALEIWEHVCREATDHDGNLDEPRARQLFGAAATRVAARGGRLGPEVGKATRAGLELYDDRSLAMFADRLAPPVRGKTTLVLAEAWQWPSSVEHGPTGAEPAVSSELPDVAPRPSGASEVARAMAAPQVSSSTDPAARLETAAPPLTGASVDPLLTALKTSTDTDAGRELPSEAQLGASEVARLLAGLQRPPLPDLAAQRAGPVHGLWDRDQPPAVPLTRNLSAAPAAPTRIQLSQVFGAPVAHRKRVPDAEPHTDGNLPAHQRVRREQAFTQRFEDVEIHPDSREVPAGTRAFTRDPFGTRSAKPVPVPRPAAAPVAAIAAPLAPSATPVVPTPARPAVPPDVVALRPALQVAAVDNGTRTAPRELRADETRVPHREPATRQGRSREPVYADLAARTSPPVDGVARDRSPAIAEPTGETAPHPVDALRRNVRGLAADLTLAGVGVGRTAARLLRRAAEAPVGRRTAELADAWTGGAAQAWTARARGWAEGATRRAMAFHERMAGPSVADQLERLPQSGGAPLTTELRARLEALFGHRFAHVRIHTDASAAQAAEAAGARAVTMGSHIYFAGGQFAPGTAAGERLLVHELTHVVQHDRGQLVQPAGPGVELSSPSDPAEHEARAMEDRASDVRNPEAAAGAAGAQPTEAASARVDAGAQPAEAASARARAAADASPTGPSSDAPVSGRLASGNWLGDKFDAAAHWVGDRVEDIENWAEDKIMGLVTTVAPGIATLIQEGPGGLIKDAIEPAISSWVGSITGGVNVGQMAGQIKGTLSSAFAVLEGAKAGDPKCCDTLVSGINAIREVAQAFVDNPVFQAIKGVFEKVSGIVETVTKLVIGPVFDVLKTIVGGAWDAIQAVASTIGKWIQAVKNVASKAFDWIARKLGFPSGSGEGGLLDWIKQKALEVWDNIKKTLQPVIGPLKVVAGVLLLFTPLPEIYAIIKYGPQIVEAVQWLWANRNNPEAAKKNPGLLGGSILPKILGTGQSFVGMVKKGVAWLIEKTTGFASGALQLLGAITGIPLLNMARGFVQTIVDGVKGMQEWAAGAFTSAAGWLEGTFHKVVDFIKPYAEVLCSVATAVTNPAMIPVILAGWAWRWLPDCIKPPLIDLLLDAVIGVLEHLPTLPLLGPLWPLLKSGVLGFLHAVRGRDPQTKIKISNKLAKIISGASPLFLLGFVKGLLKGVWDGIKMPFEAIWLILKGIGKAGDFFVALGNDADKEAQKVAKPAIPKATALPTKASAHQPTGSTHTLPSVPGEIHAGEASSVVQRIVGQLDAQKHAQVAAPASASPSNPAAPVGPGTAPAANDYRALGQQARRMGGELAGPAHTVVSGFMPAVKELFSGGGKSMSIDDLMGKLHKVWDAAKAAVAKIGAKIANMICDFLVKDSAEEEIGETIGYLVGMIAFQALLDAFSVGVWSGVNVVLTTIAKFLNWPMMFLGEAMKALKLLGGYILDGLKSLGSMVAEAGAGALREVTGALREIAGKLGEFADELMAKFGKNAGKADSAAAHTAETDAARAAEGDAARTAEGEGARKPGEGEGRPKNEGKSAAEKEALKAEELPEALEVSRGITAAAERGHVPAPVLVLALDALKRRYSWIKSYRVEARGGGTAILLIASEFVIDPRYDAQGDEDLAAWRARLQSERDAAEAAAQRGEAAAGARAEAEEQWMQAQARLDEVDKRIARQQGIATQEQEGIDALAKRRDRLWGNEKLSKNRSLDESFWSRVDDPNLNGTQLEALKNDLRAVREEVANSGRPAHLKRDMVEDLDQQISKLDHRIKRQEAMSNTKLKGHEIQTDDQLRARILGGERNVYAVDRAQAQRVSNQIESEMRRAAEARGEAFDHTQFHGPESHGGTGYAPNDPHFNVKSNEPDADFEVHIYFPP